MKQSSVKWFGYLFFFVFLIISCAGTELTHTQVNEAYKGKPVSDILVIAITGNEDSRRSYEQKFVAQLESVGVEAVSSEEVIPMPPNLEMTKEMIVNAVNQFENDAVIITHLIVGEKKETNTRAGYGIIGYYDSYHTQFSSYVRDPSNSSSRTTLLLETNLYDVKTEDIIWSGQSKTWSKDSKYQIINDVIKVVINDLLKNKLISPK
jgi:hypothetical protein